MFPISARMKTILQFKLLILLIFICQINYAQHVGLQLGTEFSNNQYARFSKSTGLFLDLNDFHPHLSLFVSFSLHQKNRTDFPCPDCNSAIMINSQYKKRSFGLLFEIKIIELKQKTFKIGFGMNYSLISATKFTHASNGQYSTISGSYYGPILASHLTVNHLFGSKFSFHSIFKLKEDANVVNSDPLYSIPSFKQIQHFFALKIGIGYPLG